MNSAYENVVCDKSCRHFRDIGKILLWYSIPHLCRKIWDSIFLFFADRMMSFLKKYIVWNWNCSSTLNLFFKKEWIILCGKRFSKPKFHFGKKTSTQLTGCYFKMIPTLTLSLPIYKPKNCKMAEIHFTIFFFQIIVKMPLKIGYFFG